MKYALFAACIILHAPNTYSAVSSGDMTVRIMSALTITKVSDLNFPVAVRGDGTFTIPAGTSDNANNASFVVNGEPSTAYIVTRPANNSVSMLKGAGGTNRQILITRFTSNITNGTLNAGGSQNLYVGATRAAITSTQEAGTYVGTFNITVVY